MPTSEGKTERESKTMGKTKKTNEETDGRKDRWANGQTGE
jgi:hypothetical protein